MLRRDAERARLPQPGGVTATGARRERGAEPLIAGVMPAVPLTHGPVPTTLERNAAPQLHETAGRKRYRRAPPEKKLGNGDRLLYLGRPITLAEQSGGRGRDSIELEKDVLVVGRATGTAGMDAVVEKWYRARAKEFIVHGVDRLNDEMRLSFSRLSIRGQRTRWASCSRRGTLSFNWKLMIAPPAVIDYVIVHELAHLAEMNHGKAFWALVARHCPDWREHRQWLREHEGCLDSLPAPC